MYIYTVCISFGTGEKRPPPTNSSRLFCAGRAFRHRVDVFRRTLLKSIRIKRLHSTYYNRVRFYAVPYLAGREGGMKKLTM